MLITQLKQLGFLLGTRQTLLETKDGENTWGPRSIPSSEEEDFNSISFKGKEGWIIGKPAILLYTADAGENWDRIPLSSQLPGDMVFAKACFLLWFQSLWRMLSLLLQWCCVGVYRGDWREECRDGYR